jgi:hypothetical protein
MAFFDDAFLEALPDEPTAALKVICDHFRQLYHNQNCKYEDFLKALALLETYLDAFGFSHAVVTIQADQQATIQLIQQKFHELEQRINKTASELELEKSKRHFSAKISKAFAYEFSDGDLKAIQDLLNKLREQIQSCKALGEDHRNRLLKRLENLQRELHKRISDLDRFWGLVGDAGVVLAKLGENAKPIIECVKQITEIVWRAQGRAEQLPSNMPPNLLIVEPSDSKKK